jgi:CheY-like chemotaxis protein
LLGASVQSGSAFHSGSGLDLVISQSLVGKLGGKIWVESEPGEGTRFIFDINVTKGKAVPEVLDDVCAKPKPELVTTEFPGKRILLVEDMEINREIVIELLEGTGVTIDWAENGRDGVAMFSEDPDKYDLIFMDIQMPEMDGYTATARIREMDAVQARNIPIVAMTANVFKEDAEHCIKAGMNGHIAKPVDKEEVLLAMQEFFVMK